MNIGLYINGTLRTDLVVTELRRSYIDPWTAQVRDPGRHDSGDHPPLWSDVRVENADTGAVLFRGELTDYEPGGVASEGATLTASGPTWRLKNTNVRINGRGHYVWNSDAGVCSDGQAGYDSPARDGRKWTAGEICVDILEHALGTGSHSSTTTSGATQSAIPGHHSTDSCVTDAYLAADLITDWDPSEWLALDTVIGEFSVEDTSVADALEVLVGRAGGFYGWHIDASGTLHLTDLDSLPETDIEAGERGHWLGEDGTDYRLLNNQLQWSLDGVATTVVVQGRDRVVEERPNNLEGSGNPGKGDRGRMEKLTAPWQGYDEAWRPREQPKRHITLKPIDEDSNYTPPEGWWNFNHAPRVYQGAPDGPKYVYDPRANETDTFVMPDVLPESGAVGLYQLADHLEADEYLWLWYWAAVPFTVQAGPSGDAYERYGYEATMTVYDDSFGHPDSYPQPGAAEEETRMQTLADRLLQQRKDVRRQGTLEVDGADPAGYGLDSRYNVLNLGPTTTTSGSTTTTTSGTIAAPTDWEQLKINAVEVTYDLERDVTELRVANTFFMLEGYSEIRRRLRNNLGRARQANSRYLRSCLSQPSYGSPSGEDGSDSTTTTTPGTTTTTQDATTTTSGSTTTTSGATTTTSGSTTTTSDSTTTTAGTTTTTAGTTTTTAGTTTTTDGTTTTTSASTTTTAGATTTTAGTTTTTAGTTTTTGGTTTTTASGVCPSDVSTCADTVYADVGHGCGDGCAGTYSWVYSGSGTSWSADTGPCNFTEIYCSDGEWITSAPSSAQAYECQYRRPADGDGDCPTGTWSQYSTYSCDCDGEITVYS